MPKTHKRGLPEEQAREVASLMDLFEALQTLMKEQVSGRISLPPATFTNACSLAGATLARVEDLLTQIDQPEPPPEPPEPEPVQATAQGTPGEEESPR